MSQQHWVIWKQSLVSSLVEKYKCGKVKLENALTEFWDSVLRGGALNLATRKQWTPAAAVLDEKIACLVP